MTAERFKVWVRGVGERDYATNGLEFDSQAEARVYGLDLLSRWFGADNFEVLPLSYSGDGDAETIIEEALHG